MNVIDSSAWLEYFADGPNSSLFAEPIEDTPALVVPTLSLFEVFKRVLQQRDENAAPRASASERDPAPTGVFASFAAPGASLRGRFDTSSSRSQPNPRPSTSRAATRTRRVDTRSPIPSDVPEARCRFREKAVAHSNCAQNRNILFKCPRWSKVGAGDSYGTGAPRPSHA